MTEYLNEIMLKFDLKSVIFCTNRHNHPFINNQTDRLTMKQYLKPALALLFTMVALVGCNDTNNPKEGDKYTQISTPISDMPMVVEVFSLSCGHCRSMETMLPEIKKMAGVDIDKVHVTFNESAQVAAYIFYTASIQTNGKPSDKLMEQLFAYTQETPETATEAEKKVILEEIFTSNNLLSPYGLSEEQHKQVYKKMTEAESIVANSQLASVPAFIVNGKYIVQSDAHQSLDDMANTIKYLTTLN